MDENWWKYEPRIVIKSNYPKKTVDVEIVLWGTHYVLAAEVAFNDYAVARDERDELISTYQSLIDKIVADMKEAAMKHAVNLKRAKP